MEHWAERQFFRRAYRSQPGNAGSESLTDENCPARRRVGAEYVSSEEIEQEREAERKVFEEKAKEEGKPDDVVGKIVEGAQQVGERGGAARPGPCNAEKHDSKSIEELRQELAAKTGENIRVARFAYFRVGAEVVSAEAAAKFGRILLKLSGEALMGELDYGTDAVEVRRLAKQVAATRERGVEVAIVVGAGNIYRGIDGAAKGIDRATGDYMGMLATVLNALMLQDALEDLGQHTRVLSAIDVKEVAEPYIRRRAIRHLEKGRVVIFAAGTGNPFFTTDTAAALRALEIKAQAILMAKNGVEGVYDSDPATNPDAEFIPAIGHREAIERDLRVMDSTALSLCMDNDLPIYVFNIGDESNIDRIVSGEKVGTLVSSAPAE